MTGNKSKHMEARVSSCAVHIPIMRSSYVDYAYLHSQSRTLVVIPCCLKAIKKIVLWIPIQIGNVFRNFVDQNLYSE